MRKLCVAAAIALTVLAFTALARRPPSPGLWRSVEASREGGGAEAAKAAAVAASNAFDAANDAWERGDFVAALNGYIQILSAPGGEKWLDPIALTTGELFQTRELTTDGRAPRFSPDGAFIAYEQGLETSRRTKILRNDPSRAEVADLPGVSATFSHPLAQVAYLKIPDNAEI